MSLRFDSVMAAIDAANAKDPTPAEADGPRLAPALLYGRRMSAVLAEFAPDAPEVLRIAARAQHIERWIIPRNSYPEGRIAYLKWRKDLQQHHAKSCGELMRLVGYGEEDIAKVGALLRKEGLKYDSLTQTLEDVICLVFLQYEAPDFIALHDDDKVRDILLKTARKMSPAALAAAGKLGLEHRLAKLLAQALAI
jgi:hypothetical protein